MPPRGIAPAAPVPTASEAAGSEKGWECARAQIDRDAIDQADTSEPDQNPIDHEGAVWLHLQCLAMSTTCVVRIELLVCQRTHMLFPRRSNGRRRKLKTSCLLTRTAHAAPVFFPERANTAGLNSRRWRAWARAWCWAWAIKRVFERATRRSRCWSRSRS